MFSTIVIGLDGGPGGAAGPSVTDAVVEIRSVRPADLEPIEGLMDAFSMSDRHLRWFSAAADVHRAAAWAAHPEDAHGVGLVACAGDEVVGHAALAPIDDDSAEIAFEVAAAWRRHGIAGRLLTALEDAARDRGMRTLVAEVLPENAQMLAVLREHGPCEERLRDGVVHVEVPVDARAAPWPGAG